MTPEALARSVAAHPRMAHLLRVAAQHGPPGGWLGAGFLRNATWDWLHGREADPDVADLDLVFHAPGLDAAPFATRLAAAEPRARWEVVNQAGLMPADDLAGAIALWPETATCVAARWEGGQVALLAPHGWEDLFALRLRPTPAFAERRAVIEARAAARGWFARWPGLCWA